MSELGRFLIGVGLAVTIAGVLVVLGTKLPGMSWFGRLPGNIYIERPHFRLYVPLGTCVVASLVLTVIFYLLRR